MKNEKIYVGLVGLLIGVVLTLLIVPTWFGGSWHGGSMMFGNRNMSSQMDAYFIEQMIPHHEDAIAMADIALQKSQHEEIKQLSRNIKVSQSREIDSMQKWYKDWFNKEVPGTFSGRMRMGMGGVMNDDLDLTTFANSNPFDKAFIEEMIPHHQMAVMMAQMLLQGTERSEMKQLAEDIIEAQTSEIEQMRQWYKTWYN